MLIVLLGTPSAVSYGIEMILREIVECLFGNCSHIYATNLDGLRSGISVAAANDQKNVMVFSDLPRPEMTSLLVKSGAPIVISSDSFYDLVIYIMRSRKHSIANAIRFASLAICTLSASPVPANVMRISVGMRDIELTALVGMLVQFYGFECGDDQFQNIIKSVSVSSNLKTHLQDYIEEKFPLSALHSGHHELLSSGQHEMLRKFGIFYDEVLMGYNSATVQWHPSLFLLDHGLAYVEEEFIELLGPARCLLFGPYLHLPTGRWSAQIEIEILDNASRNTILVEAVTNRILAQGIFTPPERGRFRFELIFEIRNSTIAIELRLHLLHGAIEGKLAVLAVALRPAL